MHARIAELELELEQVRLIACGMTASNFGMQCDNIKSRIATMRLRANTALKGADEGGVP